MNDEQTQRALKQAQALYPSVYDRRAGARIPDDVRFWATVTPGSDGCLIWTGARNPKGYGTFRTEEGTASAHRWAYTFRYGSIPDGMEIDHLCFIRACVNPDHMEPVTHAENVRRGRHNQNHGKDKCIHGHRFDEQNTSLDTLGKRVCRVCARRRTAEYRARKAETA